MLKLMGGKILTIYAKIVCLSKSVFSGLNFLSIYHNSIFNLFYMVKSHDISGCSCKMCYPERNFREILSST